MRKPILLFTVSFIVFSCSQRRDIISDQEARDLQSSIKGTWKMVSAKHISKGDTVERFFPEKIEGIKIIGDTHFSFFQHDLNAGKDSSAYFSSGAGKYLLDSNQYIEFLEYCSGRGWENRKFEFTVTVSGDSLVQIGVERIPDIGVDRTIIETYIRANDKNTPVPVINPFDEKEISWFGKAGTGHIHGIAQFKSRDGELRFGEEFRVELMPVCSYTEERLGKIYSNPKSGFVYLQDGVPSFIPDPEGYHKTILSKCNEKGEFEFSDLPQGEYYLIAFMIWNEKVGDAEEARGGGIMRRLSLSEGASEEVRMVNF